MANQNGLFGLDSRTPEERLRDNSIARQQQELSFINQSLAGLRNPADRAAAQTGGLLGALVGQRLNPTKLTPQDQQDLAIQSDARATFASRLGEAMQKGPVDDAQKAEIYQQSLADAAFNHGNYAAFNAISQNVAQMKLKRQQAKAQLALNDAYTNQAKANTSATQYKLEQAKAGETTDAVLPESNGIYAPDAIFNAVSGKVMPDGTFRQFHPDGSYTDHKQYMTLAQAQTNYDLWDKAQQKANATGNKPVDILSKLIPATERQNARTMAANAHLQVQVTDGIMKYLSNVMKQGVDPDVILGDQGKILNFVENARDLISSVGSYATTIYDKSTGKPIIGGDMSTPGQQNLLAQKDPVIKDAIAGIQIPPQFKGAKEHAEYVSAITQLAYALAHSNDPAARQLSDQDYAQAIRQLGAASGNAGTLMQVIMDNLGRGMDQLKVRVDQYRNVAKYPGFNSQQADQLIFGENMDSLLNQTNALQDRVTHFIGNYNDFQNVQQEEDTARKSGVLPSPTAAPQESDEDLLKRVLGQ